MFQRNDCRPCRYGIITAVFAAIVAILSWPAILYLYALLPHFHVALGGK